MSFTKTITPAYEQVGRRQKLTGFDGVLTDESGIVIHSMEYSHYGAAERALDALTYELLMDLAERGLTDTVPALDPPGPNPEDENEGDEAPEWRIGRPCPTCGGDGDCPDCGTYTQPLLVDVHTVLSQCLNNAPAKAMVPELRRLLARAESELSMDDTKQQQPTGWCYVCGAASWNWTAQGPLCPSHYAVLDEYATA